ncbi:MAG TPA: hypothetical protein VMH31_15660 [Methylomirabilota bacterium]|nr:hypothetical protein [Methylomirabilota bacterium]
MDIGTKIAILATGALVVLGCSVYVAWQAVRREQAVLQQRLNAAEQRVHDATARQETRDSELKKNLDQLAQEKRNVQTPKQVLGALPEVLPLPEPLSADVGFISTPLKSADDGQASPRTPAKSPGGPNAPEPPKIALPVDDLKPLYDFAVTCKACEAELAAAQADLKDERLKTGALSRERDSALQAARGGSVMKRVVRAAKWFALGAAAGVVAAKLAH